MPTIEFDNVSKSYTLGSGTTSLREAFPGMLYGLLRRPSGDGQPHRKLWALKDVSFALDRSQVLGIIGPNGAGKTTTLKLLSRITKPTQGRVVVDGRISALIELGAGFHPDLTGTENLWLNASILGLSRRDIAAKYGRIVEFSGLGDFMDTPVKRYSSGMYVRLGFAVAAHMDPDILLVDEVLAVGDASFQRQCMERIRELKARGTTIVFISHSMPLVRSICDNAMFLQNGQAQAFGPTMEVIRIYEAALRSQEARSAVRLNQTHQGLDAFQNSPVSITSIRLTNLTQPGSDHFSFSDNLGIQLHFCAEKLIPTPTLTLRIIRSDGTTCCEARSSDQGVLLPDLEGDCSISLSIEPVQLASGVYVVDARLADISSVAPLALGQSDWFRVSGLSVETVYEYGGVYVPRIRWGSMTNSREPVNAP